MSWTARRSARWSPLLVGAAALAAVGTCAASTTSARAVAPWIHQRGATFVNARGQTVLLRGVNVTPAQAADFAQVVALHANLVRIPIKWSLVETTAPQGDLHIYDEQELARIDAEVRFFLERRINVLIDFHQSRWSSFFQEIPTEKRPAQNDLAGIPSWLYAGGPYPPTLKGRAQAQAAFYGDQRATDLFRSFVRMIVERYRVYPNVVGYEILNEPQVGALPPTHGTTQLVLEWEGKIRQEIRDADPLRTVFFMLRTGGDLGVKQADLTPLGSRSNLALDLHDYFAGNTGSGYTADGEARSATFARTSQVTAYTGTLANQRAYLATVLARTRAWNIPLLVGEWGARRDDPKRLVYQSQMLSLFGSLGLGWTRWDLDRSHQFGILDGAGKLNDAGLQLSRYLASSPATPRQARAPAAPPPSPRKRTPSTPTH